MSESNHLCYVRCDSCTAVMGVNLPCENLFNAMTIQCGHCTCLLWVNAKASPLTLGQTSTSNTKLLLNKNFNYSEIGNHEVISSDSDSKRESTTSTCKVPEKRQREPSVYNRFIKEEIQRIKAANPDISHKKAFSTASKNWALVPYMHFDLSQDGNKQA
ncbi:hypothetical protein SUGI_1098100 [Cryptomeria japonica]|uniref:axial regulator YABBY 5 n=1 Tax=Cryptomeria japonica TaxID=3369 RepID=UPI002414A6B4|nr:axial regulator YABBY 5 [Cryptomeria japonica]XP_057824109.1 axial regulator YABBY 5 [Cryptomeria japonica]GLJ51676.1 hypothetical protein SUGI_1098100 [Cryptomeria japonica]